MEQISTRWTRGPCASECGCASKKAAAHGKSTQEQDFPGGLQPTGNLHRKGGNVKEQLRGRTLSGLSSPPPTLFLWESERSLDLNLRK